jgi:hypothetical protein
LGVLSLRNALCGTCHAALRERVADDEASEDGLGSDELDDIDGPWDNAFAIGAAVIGTMAAVVRLAISYNS